VTTSTVELLASKYGMTPTQAQDAQRSMEQRAAGLGLTFRMDALRSGNTRTAHRLLHLARERGVQTALVERLHRAYFTEQGSIFDAAALVDHAVEVGLERDEAAAVVAGDRYDDAVAHDEALARSFGATGVPFFVIDRRYAISGAQPAEAILAVLQRAHADAQSADSEQVTA
jgi:predicted DsbA family dithiol-disulfide isomerase